MTRRCTPMPGTPERRLIFRQRVCHAQPLRIRHPAPDMAACVSGPSPLHRVPRSRAFGQARQAAVRMSWHNAMRYIDARHRDRAVARLGRRLRRVPSAIHTMAPLHDRPVMKLLRPPRLLDCRPGWPGSSLELVVMSYQGHNLTNMAETSTMIGTIVAEGLAAGTTIDLPIMIRRIHRVRSASADAGRGQPPVWTLLDFSCDPAHPGRRAVVRRLDSRDIQGHSLRRPHIHRRSRRCRSTGSSGRVRTPRRRA